MLPAISAENSLTASFQRKMIADLCKNWRLTLLGVTGVVLSVASGWTTYDGIANFTGNGVLSLLITFGIQGVMLVSAWLIGESFATGATGETSAATSLTNTGLTDIVKKAFFLSVTASLLFFCAWFLARYILQYDTATVQQTLSENIFSVLIVLGSIITTSLFLIIFSNAEIIGPYARGVRVMLAHIPLWVMFTCCMATSVFFSFDSLFSSIFPAEERKRAGELRAQGQIAGLIADLDAVIKKRRDDISRKLFSSQSWNGYERDLARLTDSVRKAPNAIEAQVIAKLKKRQNALAEQHEQLSGARSRQKNLGLERKQLIAKISRLEQQLPKRRVEAEELEVLKRTKKSEISQKRAIAEAEAKGVGDTGRVGRGPIYRELNKSVTRINIDIQAIEEQLLSANQFVDELESRRIELNASLVQIDRDLARQSSQEKSAQEGIKIQEDLSQKGQNVSLDMTGGLKVLEQELNSFRQQPLRSTLINIQQSCTSLIQAVGEVEALKDKTKGIDCNPFESGEISGQIFAINANLVKYQAICGKEAHIPNDIDALLKFGQQCVLISGLTGAETRSFRQTLNRMALNRDDKAHRFVVTWNSFVDGNRLAYLALVIAIAIDGLVFMTGLFGANAIVSPLADSPRARNRPIAQLEEIVDNALLPDKILSAELMASVIKPVMDENDTGFIALIDLGELSPEQDTQIRKILTAGAVLGLIKQEDPSSSIYLVRSELIEYISSVRAHEEKFKIRPEISSQQESVRLLSTDELQPHRIPIAKPAPEQLPKQFRIVSSSQASHPRISDSRTDDQRIRDSFLNALDLKEATLERVDEFNRDADMSPDEMQLWLDGIQDTGSRVSQILDRTGTRLKEKVFSAANRLKQDKASDENWIQLVDEQFEMFNDMLPGILIYKVYEKSHERAEQVKLQYSQLRDTVKEADKDVNRHINNLLDNIDEAERNKFDGLQNLDKYTLELEFSLNQLLRLNRAN